MWLQKLYFNFIFTVLNHKSFKFSMEETRGEWTVILKGTEPKKKKQFQRKWRRNANGTVNTMKIWKDIQYPFVVADTRFFNKTMHLYDCYVLQWLNFSLSYFETEQWIHRRCQSILSIFLLCKSCTHNGKNQTNDIGYIGEKRNHWYDYKVSTIFLSFALSSISGTGFLACRHWHKITAELRK